MGRQTQIYADRALNAEIWDIEGRRYIDVAAGSAVVNTGHCHAKVMAAVTGQMGRFTHTCHQVLPCETCIRRAERLNAAAPGDFAKKTVFVTTGAESAAPPAATLWASPRPVRCSTVIEEEYLCARDRDRRHPRPGLHGGRGICRSAGKGSTRSGGADPAQGARPVAPAALARRIPCPLGRRGGGG